MRPRNVVFGLAFCGIGVVLSVGAQNSVSGGAAGDASSLANLPGLGEPFQITEEIIYGPSSKSQSEPAVASDGRDYLVVWADHYQSLWRRIRGARVTAGGTVLDTLVITIGGGWGRPAVAIGESDYLVVWETGDEENLDILGARVGPSGTLPDNEAMTISSAPGYQVFPAVSSDGVSFLVVWADNRSGRGFDIYGARVAPSGEVLDPNGIPISTAGFDQGRPDIVFDGTNYLVVWYDYRNEEQYLPAAPSNGDIYCARVSPSGQVLDSEGIPVSTRDGHQWFPQVASDGTNSLVVWEDEQESSGDIYCARVAPSGEVLDQEGIPIAVSGANHYCPSVVYDGTNYAVAWAKLTGYKALKSARVSPSGEVIDPGGWNVSSVGIVWGMAAGSENALLVLVRGALDQGSSIYGTRITSSAETLAPESFPISLGMNQQFRPCVARSGTQFIVAWMDGRRGCRDIYMSRIGFFGSSLDAAPVEVVTSGTVEPYPMAAAGTNREAMFVWLDSREGSDKVFSARISSSGEVLDPNGFGLCDSTARPADPNIASDGGDYLALWTDLREDRHKPHIYGTRVSGEGVVRDPDGLLISAGRPAKEPAAAFGQNNYFVVWTEPENVLSVYGLTIVGTRVSRSGDVLDPEGIVLSDKGDRIAYPTVAFDGCNYLVAWSEFLGHEIGVSGAIVNQSGVVLNRFEIEDELEFYSPSRISAVFDGTNFVLSWPSRGITFECHGSRVRPSGEVIDSTPFVVSGRERTRREVSMATMYPGHTLIAYPRLTGTPFFDCYRIWGNLLCVESIEPEFEFVASPNPFSSTSLFHYYLPGDAHVRICIYDAAGRLVKTVADGPRGPGPQQEIWDGTNDNGRAVSSGVYFARFRSGFGNAKARCILAR